MSGGWGTPSWQGGDPTVGETFVEGKTPETARYLLAAAAELGVDGQTIRTVTRGFIAPTPVVDLALETARTNAGLTI